MVDQAVFLLTKFYRIEKQNTDVQQSLHALTLAENLAPYNLEVKYEIAMLNWKVFDFKEQAYQVLLFISQQEEGLPTTIF